MNVSVRGAWIVCGLSLALITIGAGIGVATWSVSLPPSLVPRGIVLLAAPLISVLGALITMRVPGNAIGYVFLGAGLVGAVQLVSEQVAFAAQAWPMLTPIAPWAALAFYALGTANSLGLILYVLALFPNGRLATRGERRAMLSGTVGVLGIFAAASMVSERIPVPFSKYDNPLGHPELRPVAFVIGIVATGAYVLALGSVGFGSVRRFRRSAGVERQQLKWFAYAAALATAGLVPLYLVLFIAFATNGQQVFDAPPLELRALIVVSSAMFILLPVAVAVAILRYRLYDIDLLINRTVLYVWVTAMLVALFTVLSTLAQRALETVAGQRSELVNVTLLIAVALGFAPIRKRIQPFVDHLLPARGLLTLLFTDIVGSTERAVALGDDRWRTLLDAYRAAVRRELAKFGGREVDTAGDGFFATFERPPQAIACAIALRAVLHELGLDSRIGLHAGECELRGERVSGLNVIVAARIMAIARANEIVVSGELRNLLAGAHFGFRDHGVESLKGVPGEWRLSIVGDAQ